MDTKRNTKPLENGDVVTSIRLTRDQHTRLKALAASEYRSLSGEMRKMVEDRLADDSQDGVDLQPAA